MTDWTKEQRDALEHTDGGAIVSASAGSGKTAVLTERVVRLITESKADPADIAVVTFTEKAAAELKARLNRKMREQTALHPESAEFLRRQTARLQNAKISTISSFCFKLLRENSHLTGLSAGFTVMDEQRSDILKRAVLDGVLDDFYLSADEEELAVVQKNFISRSDKDLAELILKVYAFCVNMPDYESWLDSLTGEGFLQALKKRARDAQIPAAKSALEAYRLFYSAASAIPSQENYLKQTERGRVAALEHIAAYGGITREELKSYIAQGPAKKSQLRDAKAKELREKFLALSDSALEQADKLAELESDSRRYLPVQELVVKLTKRFAERYRLEKRAQNTADFADGEQECFRLLKEHPEAVKNAAPEYIIVDEFQDSNEIQYEIFRRLSDDEKNLYFVGDLKQSIYSFRGAQPEVFASVAADERYTLYPLNSNFRSRKNVIDGVNAIFSAIMTEKLGGANYARDSMLVCSRTDGYTDEDVTELVAVKSDDNGGEAEYVAERIKEMLDSRYEVKGRPCREEDFVILLRSPRSVAANYVRALKERGLKSCTDTEEVFTERPEIRLMTDYLTVLDDPYNDIALARLLMSSAFGFDAENMSRLRTGTCGVSDLDGLIKACPDEMYRYSDEYSEKRLFTCLTATANGGFSPDREKYPQLARLAAEGKFGIVDRPDEKCLEFLNELYRLRGFMAGSSPAALIQKIYDSTQVKNLLMICEDPDNRAAGLRRLTAAAKDCEEQGGLLSDFLHRLEDNARFMGKTGDNSRSAGVRIMSVHGAKGLQFPICFVSGCSKMFNTEDLKHGFIISRNFGIAGQIVDRELMLRRPSPAHTFAKNEQEEKLRSEEMRLLYVAATRAEEKLIFTGSADRIYNDSYMGWLRSANSDDGKPLDFKDVNSVMCYGGKVKFSCVKPNASEISEPEREEWEAVADREQAERIAKRLEYKYPFAALCSIAAKYTATELVQNRRVQNGTSEYCELYISRPPFLTDTGKLSGKRRGDAYHKVMQYLPMEKALDEEEVQAEIDRLGDLLDKKERECVVPADIAKFYRTEQAERMIKSGRIYREQPIFHKLDVSKLTAAELGVSEEEKAACADAEPYVQGIADLFFIENDKIILIDYKSDSFSDEEKLSADYGFQLEIYADALEKMYRMPVTEKYIYSFRLGKMINIADTEGEK